MSQLSSANYIIDTDFNIVSFNETAKKICTQIEKGAKCYKSVAGKDAPCDKCPVLNGIKGPKFYHNDVNDKYVGLNAIDINFEDGSKGYSLVFDILEETKTVALTTNMSEEEYKLWNIINTLTSDISDLYCVDIKSKIATAYRFTGNAIGLNENLTEGFDYDGGIRRYINANVHPEDRDDMVRVTLLENVIKHLEKQTFFIYHYRVFRNDEIHYYYLKCIRNNDGSGKFDSIIFAFGCEDEQVYRQQIEETFAPGGKNKKRKILVVEDNELDREILCDVLKNEYEVLEASDGFEGLEILNRQFKEISVVLLDLIMPRCSGYEFLEKINKDETLSAIPVVVLSSSEAEKEEERCFELGAVEFLTKPYNSVRIKSRIHNIVRMKETAATLDIVEIDELTGLYTKHAFMYNAKQYLDANPNDNFNLMIADIENFRLINNIYGEEKGNEVLRFVADAFNKSSGGILARFSGDQFVGMGKVVDKPGKDWIENLTEYVKKNAPVPNLILKFGIYMNVDRNITIPYMCDRAMVALKSIKHNYNAIYALYDGPVSQKYYRSQMYEAKFQEAIANKEFKVWYQPKYDPYTNTPVGAEALVRWLKDGKIIPPFEFLSVYEEDGLIGILDEYVFTEVCRQQREWRDRGNEIVPVSINLSRNSMHKIEGVYKYSEIAKKYEIEPEFLPIEITESAEIGSVEIKSLVDSFHKEGFPLHMDDFGSGRSSLHSLNVLDFDVVKIDKGLIDFIGRESGDTVLTYTIAMANKLGLKIVAEGVEHQTQLEFLMDKGCNAIQGYCYSKPLPALEFEQLMQYK